jgi:hypothetical protein
MTTDNSMTLALAWIGPEAWDRLKAIPEAKIGKTYAEWFSAGARLHPPV